MEIKKKDTLIENGVNSRTNSNSNTNSIFAQCIEKLCPSVRGASLGMLLVSGMFKLNWNYKLDIYPKVHMQRNKMNLFESYWIAIMLHWYFPVCVKYKKNVKSGV